MIMGKTISTWLRPHVHVVNYQASHVQNSFAAGTAAQGFEDDNMSVAVVSLAPC